MKNIGLFLKNRKVKVSITKKKIMIFRKTVINYHYLSHKLAIKMDSTTRKLRLVFDASAKEKRNTLLNWFLEK